MALTVGVCVRSQLCALNVREYAYHARICTCLFLLFLVYSIQYKHVWAFFLHVRLFCVHHAYSVSCALTCLCVYVCVFLKGISISTPKAGRARHPSILLLYTPKHQKPRKQPRWREITLCVISLPLTLLSALPFMSVIVGDYFNCEKGSR